MRWRCGLLFLLAGSAFASNAAAEVVRDDSTGFSLDIDVRPDAPCVVLPRGRAHGSACATTNAQALATSLANQPDTVLWAARVDRGPFAYVLVVSRRPGAGEFQEADVPLLMTNLRESNKSFHARDLKPTLWRSNGVQILTAPLTMVAQGTPTRAVSYFIAGAGVYVLTTMTDESRARDVEVIAEHALSTVKLRQPPVATPAPSPGEADAEVPVLDTPSSPDASTPLAESVSYFVRAVIFLVLLGAVVYGVRALGRLGQPRR